MPNQTKHLICSRDKRNGRTELYHLLWILALYLRCSKLSVSKEDFECDIALVDYAFADIKSYIATLTFREVF